MDKIILEQGQYYFVSDPVKIQIVRDSLILTFEKLEKINAKTARTILQNNGINPVPGEEFRTIALSKSIIQNVWLDYFKGTISDKIKARHQRDLDHYDKMYVEYKDSTKNIVNNEIEEQVQTAKSMPLLTQVGRGRRVIDYVMNPDYKGHHDFAKQAQIVYDVIKTMPRFNSLVVAEKCRGVIRTKTDVKAIVSSCLSVFAKEGIINRA